MAEFVAGFWREKDNIVEAKPKVCPHCRSRRVRDWKDDGEDDESDDECLELWLAEQGRKMDYSDWDEYAPFYYYRDAVECRACGLLTHYGQRHYFNVEAGNYDLDRILPPLAANRHN
jgi:hypothetical protein